MTSMSYDIYQTVKRFQRIALSPKITFDDARFVFNGLNKYFGEFERSQKFRGTEIELSIRFNEFLDFFNKEQGVYFTTHFFLFCYTLTQDYKQIQSTIFTNIALPFQNWVINNWQAFTPAIKDIKSGNEYVFVCRHAATVGPYAPGSSVYTFANALLEANRKVTIISLGVVCNQFAQLSKKHNNLKIYTIKQLPLVERFSSLVELLKVIQPKAILSEIEFDIVSVLSILKPNLPTIFLSAGFYSIPWFDKIGVTDSLEIDATTPRKNDFFEIPTYVSNKVLNPPVDKKIVSHVKGQIGISKNDFVIGSFARMEKFQKPFLKLIKNVLDECPNAKIILAGSNDRSPVEHALNEYTTAGRAVVLPLSNVHVLGHCVSLGIDTFPTHSGFSVLELMAKGVPVVAKKDIENHINLRQRVPELIRDDDSLLLELICDFVKNPCELKKFYKPSKELAASGSNDLKFISALDHAIADKSLQYN